MALLNTNSTTPNATPERNGVISSTRFRKEVMEQRTKQWLGKTTLALPLSFAVYSAAALGLVAAIITFLIFGSFAQTESVSAVIAPEGGVTKVLASVEGDVSKILVHEGDRVSKGTPLFRIRTLQGQFATEAEEPVQKKRSGNTEVFETIKAPVSGRVYTLSTQTGDKVSVYNREPIATIAADNSLMLLANVTSAVQAHVHTGTIVQVELDAFKGRPQGKLHAQVVSVAAEPSETFDLLTGGNKLSYKVAMRIDSDTISYPRDELLGKTVKVKFALEKRRLYQWLLDPLQTLFGA